ncbi:MAG: hypothetical protein ABR498_08810 [Candidatus Dormibacteria bacterium]
MQGYAAEPYLPVSDVAERLGVPLAILLRRIEAGDVPAQRIDAPDGVQWRVRLSDLGVQPPAEENGAHEAAVEEEPSPQEHTTGSEPEVIIAGEDGTAEGIDHAQADQPGQPVVPENQPQPVSDAERTVARLEEAPVQVRDQVAGLRIDPHELVSGLLDRWERTLEQRIYAEQRQRFEGELIARQNLVKQLQLELQTARAEHAALQADRDRRMAELERRLWDTQRDLDTAQTSLTKRHGIFRRH